MTWQPPIHADDDVLPRPGGGAMECRWCGAAFELRASGGSRQRFCSSRCRRAFDSACRIYAAREVDAGRLRVSDLRTALQQRARCAQRP